jgi:ABC-type uncharacterized transport system ATPase subunit
LTRRSRGTATGAGIQLISTDLSEVLALSNRVTALFGGLIIFSREPATLPLETIGLTRAGVAQLEGGGPGPA